MNLFKNLFVFLAFAATFAFVGCGDDEVCDGKTCGANEILNGATCTCVSTLPCSGKTCADGEILDASTCNCVESKCDKTCATGEILNASTCECEVAEPIAHSGFITESETWTSDRIHELAGKVVVSEGATLTIMPGTIVKGRTGTGSLASALVVARGAKIEACGSADSPIIFTSVVDNIKVGEKSGSNLGVDDREKWGGLILLGKAPVSAKNGDTQAQIEGIPGDETYGKYGGDDESDSSGSLCYISIRHGGALIGDGNEINGLTLGGVGSGTKIENVEVVGNLDDGIEFFGGTVNVKNALVAYQGDDAIDIDQNYSGTVENVYIIHGGDDTDEAFEIDGPENKTYNDGKFTVKNATAVAADQTKTSGADLKSKAQGTLENVVWSGYKTGKGVAIEAVFSTEGGCTAQGSAYSNFADGNLKVKDSEYVSEDANVADFAKVKINSKKDNATDQQACLDGSDYQVKADEAIVSEGNKVVKSATASKGADVSAFDWTWTKAQGLIK